MNQEIVMEPFQIGMALRGAYLTLHRRANTLLTEFGITADQWVVLTALSEEDGITQQELVRRVYSDPNTITAMLKLLEDRELVRREPHPTDRRARCIYLTTQSRELQSQTQIALHELHRSFKFLFSPEEGESFVRSLHEIIDVFHPTRVPALANGEKSS
jgi:MarR family transcriptional regulator, organic hydroperoxide resistance regulator